MSTRTPIVYVVDDDQAVRRSLEWLLESVGLAVETFPSAQAFLQRYDPSRPSCLVLDLRMPGMSGLELQDHLAERDISIPIVFVTAHGEVATSVRAMKGGAVDFIEKPFSDHELLECIQRALKEDLRARVRRAEREDHLARLARLTPRERQVLDLVVQGFINKQIADRLGVSEKTVEVHRSRVMAKMEARSVAALVRMALQGAADGVSPTPDSGKPQ